MNEQVGMYMYGRQIVECVEDHEEEDCNRCHWLEVSFNLGWIEAQGGGESQKDLPWLGT